MSRPLSAAISALHFVIIGCLDLAVLTSRWIYPRHGFQRQYRAGIAPLPLRRRTDPLLIKGAGVDRSSLTQDFTGEQIWRRH